MHVALSQDPASVQVIIFLSVSNPWLHVTVAMAPKEELLLPFSDAVPYVIVIYDPHSCK